MGRNCTRAWSDTDASHGQDLAKVIHKTFMEAEAKLSKKIRLPSSRPSSAASARGGKGKGKKGKKSKSEDAGPMSGAMVFFDMKKRCWKPPAVKQIIKLPAMSSDAFTWWTIYSVLYLVWVTVVETECPRS